MSSISLILRQCCYIERVFCFFFVPFWYNMRFCQFWILSLFSSSMVRSDQVQRFMKEVLPWTWAKHGGIKLQEDKRSFVFYFLHPIESCVCDFPLIISSASSLIHCRFLPIKFGWLAEVINLYWVAIKICFEIFTEINIGFFSILLT